MKTWNGYPEIFSSFQALEISRQYLLFRAVIFTEYSRWMPLSFVKIVVFSEVTIWYRIETDQPSIWMLRRGLQVEYSYAIKDSLYLKMCISFLFFLFFFLKKLGRRGGGPPPAWARMSLYCVSNNTSVVYFFFFLFWPSHIRVNKYISLLLSRLEGYPSIEYLYLADSSLARVGS